jgi:predicted DNA-binding ribbon-helix-helix protein
MIRLRAVRGDTNVASQDEVRTTITLDAGLHVWLRQYAIAQRMSFMRLVADILTEWAKNHGYTPKPKKDIQP